MAIDSASTLMIKYSKVRIYSYISENKRQQEFDETFQIISGMQELPISTMSNFFQYKKENIKIQKDMEREIEEEYRSSIADPTRIVAIHERVLMANKDSYVQS
jgi:hypothetical protein